MRPGITTRVTRAGGLAVLALAAAAAAEPCRAQGIEREFDVESGQLLSVDLRTGGSVTIEGWDRAAVAVSGTKRGRDCELVRVDTERTAGGVELRSRLEERRRDNRCQLHFDVHVPQRFDLDLETMGGTIRITGVDGSARGRTMGGDLVLSRLGGTVRLSTMGGNIELTDSDVDGTVKTMGGHVRLADVVGNVRGSSMGGDVEYHNVTERAGKSSGDEVRIHTMGGAIDVRDAPVGANVETMGGNIRIGSAADHVKAQTMGGRIDIAAVDGWVEATTMGGDVEVRMIGDAARGDRHATLVSMSGDVTLVVPADLSMDVDITLAYTRNSDGDYRIVSDFPIRLEETASWTDEEGHGSPRKYIYGKGEIAGGRHRIHIETVNGNVYLKRTR